jgi:hypothetical protein
VRQTHLFPFFTFLRVFVPCGYSLDCRRRNAAAGGGEFFDFDVLVDRVDVLLAAAEGDGGEAVGVIQLASRPPLAMAYSGSRPSAVIAATAAATQGSVRSRRNDS